MPSPLTDMEMHELLRILYPEHVSSDDDEYFNLSQDVHENAYVDLGDGKEVTLADFLGRVVMMAMPVRSELSGKMYHCLGRVDVSEDHIAMTAAVRREVTP